MNSERLVETARSFLRPIKRFLNEALLGRLYSRYIKHRRIRSEARHLGTEIEITRSTILFNIQYHWYYSWIDYTLAAAMRYRGYESVAFLCDGLPYCEYETVSVKRPKCAHCHNNTKQYVEAFGLKVEKLSEYIDQEEMENLYRIAYGTPIPDLMDYKYNNTNIGEIAYRNYIHYYKGVYKISSNTESIFRKCVYSALIVYVATLRAARKIRPVKIVSPNGKFIQSALSLEVAKQLQLPYYTWDVFSQQFAVTLAKNGISHDQKIDDVWEEVKKNDLTDEQNIELDTFFSLQAKSMNTPYKYYNDNVITTKKDIMNNLKITKGKKLITLFPNVEWDSTAMGMHGPYNSMHDWVFSIINIVTKSPNFELIIRAHPGEKKVPYHLKTTTPICDVIREKTFPIPKNVHLIEPENNISSYTLAGMSDVSMVYTSTLGIEFALNGIMPWVAANCYYAHKGFTLDITSREQVEVLLQGNLPSKYLSSDQIEAARKLAYAVKFRRSFNYPLFNKNGNFKMHDYNLLFPGNEPVIDNICDFINDKRNCLDIGPLNR